MEGKVDNLSERSPTETMCNKGGTTERTVTDKGKGIVGSISVEAKR